MNKDSSGDVMDFIIDKDFNFSYHEDTGQNKDVLGCHIAFYGDIYLYVKAESATHKTLNLQNFATPIDIGFVRSPQVAKGQTTVEELELASALGVKPSEVISIVFMPTIAEQSGDNFKTAVREFTQLNKVCDLLGKATWEKVSKDINAFKQALDEFYGKSIER